MAGLELIVLIGAAVLVGEVAARHFRLPPPLALLVIGSGLSFVPALHSAERVPNVVLLFFLPALVYWESQNNTSLREIRANLRIIVLPSCAPRALSTTGQRWCCTPSPSGQRPAAGT